MKLRDPVAVSFFEGLKAMNHHVSVADMMRYLGLPSGISRGEGFIVVANNASENHERENPSLHQVLCRPSATPDAEPEAEDTGYFGWWVRDFGTYGVWHLSKDTNGLTMACGASIPGSPTVAQTRPPAQRVCLTCEVARANGGAE